MIVIHFLPSHFVLMQWTSWAIMTLSKMLRLAIKSAYSCEIRLGKTILNILATTFITNLYITEQRLTGRNLLKCSRLSFFGIRTIKVLFKKESMLLPTNTPQTHSQTALPAVSHWLWKKWAWYPSLLRAFRGVISNKTFLISSSVTAVLKNSMSWAVNRGNN